jgi:hypothetical protein
MDRLGRTHDICELLERSDLLRRSLDMASRIYSAVVAEVGLTVWWDLDTEMLQVRAQVAFDFAR